CSEPIAMPTRSPRAAAFRATTNASLAACCCSVTFTKTRVCRLALPLTHSGRYRSLDRVGIVMSKPARKKKTKSAVVEMTTAEAAVATLIGHGLDTVYALPGVHNDHLFDAFH